MVNAANSDKIVESRDRIVIEREQELEDLRKVLATPEGVRFVQRVMNEGHIFHTTFTGNSTTYFNEGRRSMALFIYKDVFEAAPEKLYDIMLQERKANDDRPSGSK